MIVLDISYRSVPMPGQSENGDAALSRSSNGVTLLAVVDGLGHGPKAHAAARAATDTLNAADLDQDVAVLMQQLHAALRGTRGAAATLCMIRGDDLEGCGVGNVELRQLGCELPIVLSPGVLGSRLRTLRCFRGKLRSGARLAMYSDGVSGRFALRDFSAHCAQETCELLLRRHGREQDDSTVLVVDVEDVRDTRR